MIGNYEEKILSGKIIGIVDNIKELSSYLNNWNGYMFLFNLQENDLKTKNLTVCKNLKSIKYYITTKYGKI